MNSVVLWIVVGMMLAGAEIFTGSFGILWFAISAFGAAALAWMGFGPTAQVLALSVGGLGLFALTRPLARRIQQGRGLKTNAHALIGQVGEVTRPIGGPQDPGYVRLGGDEWRAAAPGPLPVGARAVVKSITGATLQVEAAGGPITKEERHG
jgi:membrane protein implicated in regulation of membrane protease activity